MRPYKYIKIPLSRISPQASVADLHRKVNANLRRVSHPSSAFQKNLAALNLLVLKWTGDSILNLEASSFDGCIWCRPDRGRPNSEQRMRFLPFLIAGLGVISPIAGVTAFAACKVPIPAASLDDFVARPAHYLDRYPSGGDVLSDAVRNFAAFDRSGLKGVRLAIRTANALQKRAIGGGLAKAVAACLSRDGEIAKQIAEVVKMSGDQDIVEGFLAVADDDPAPTPANGLSSGSRDVRGSDFVKPGQALALPSVETPKPVPDLKKFD